VPAQARNHPVVTGFLGEVGGRCVPLAVQRLLGHLDLPPGAVVPDDAHERDVLADGAVVLHGVEPERAVAIDDQHLLVGLRQLRGDGE
jgi:hypothetical protein